MWALLVKILIGSLAILAVMIWAGVSGVLFFIWPTFWPDQKLVVTAATLEQLLSLRQQPKFTPNEKLFYHGAPYEGRRLAGEKAIDSLLEGLIVGLPHAPRKSFVLKSFKAVLPKFEPYDSEEKDRTVSYLNEVMDILGIQSSNELLNVWRYGFPYGLVLSSKR
jgi:hypothetical protein